MISQTIQSTKTELLKKQDIYLCPTCGSEDLIIEEKVACCLKCGKLIKSQDPKSKLAKIELLPYKQKLKCKICNGVFPSYYAFSKHYLIQHKQINRSDLDCFDKNGNRKKWKNVRSKYKLKSGLSEFGNNNKPIRGYGLDPETPIENFDFIMIDGDYITNRIAKCKTQKVHFYPRDDYLKIIKSYKNPWEILDKAEKEIVQKCGIRICPKCSSHRFHEKFKRYYPFIKKFKYPKMVCLEVKKHYPLSLEYKRELEQKFRNFLRKLERDLQKNPTKFIEKRWIKKKMRAGDYGDIEETIRLYKNHKLQYIRGLGLVIKKENFYYWHFHCVFDLPYINAEYLAKRWKEQTGSSIHIEKVGPLSKEEEEKFKKSKEWKKIKKEHPNEKESRLRAIWYITKYICRMESWLTPDQYARFGYGKNFVQKSHSITKLGLKATSRQGHYKKVKLKNGETLEIPLVFVGIEWISGKPPPKPQKNAKLNHFRPDSELNRLMKEFQNKQFLDLKYAQKHYSKKLINQLSKKGLIIKTFSRIYPR